MTPRAFVSAEALRAAKVFCGFAPWGVLYASGTLYGLPSGDGWWLWSTLASGLVSALWLVYGGKGA